jgi:prephenate dehydrogenase
MGEATRAGDHPLPGRSGRSLDPGGGPGAAVLGLGLIGASLCLALRATGRFATVVAWDPELETAQRARKLNVADRLTGSVAEAVRGAAAVFVAVAPDQMREVLAAAGAHLEQGAVVCSLDEGQEHAMALARELIPGSVSFVAAHPLLWEVATAESEPSASLFQQGTVSLSSLPSAHPDAVAFVASVAEALGMTTFFVDPREHDAFFSGVGRLPSLLAAALIRVATREPSWRELSRLAGGDFRHATSPVEASPSREQQALALSREHMVRWLDTLMAELGTLREALQDGREPPDLYTAAAEARRRWLRERQLPPGTTELPPSPSTPRRRFWF